MKKFLFLSFVLATIFITGGCACGPYQGAGYYPVYGYGPYRYVYPTYRYNYCYPGYRVVIQPGPVVVVPAQPQIVVPAPRPVVVAPVRPGVSPGQHRGR